MPKRKLEMKLDHEEEKLLLPSSSSDDEFESKSDVSNEEEPETEDHFLFDDSDSDNAPETVSFKSALEDSKKLRHHTTQVIKTHLEEKKRRRKEIHDQVMKQKEEKKLKIDEKKLPDDVLENLKDPTGENKHIVDENETGYEVEEEIVKGSVSDDVVAVHGPTIFKCKVLSVESKKPKFVSDEIAHFKDNLLYGGRIRRERSSREAMLKAQKQLVNQRLRCVK